MSFGLSLLVIAVILFAKIDQDKYLLSDKRFLHLQI